MADLDLETLATEYMSAKYARDAHRRRGVELEQSEQKAASALIEAIIESGQYEYGPITSDLVWNELACEYRRVWRAK